MSNPLIARFNELAARTPSRKREVYGIAIGVAMTVALWERRGAVAGVIALLIYGLGSIIVLLQHDETVAWSKDHPWLDSLVLVPLVFLALAFLAPHRSLLICAAIGWAAWVLVMVPRVLYRRAASPNDPGPDSR